MDGVGNPSGFIWRKESSHVNLDKQSWTIMDKRLLIVPQVNLHRILFEPGSNITLLGLMLDETFSF